MKEGFDVPDFLEAIPTATLVKELRQRSGVEVKEAEPYQDIDVKVSGPAVVLIVFD